MPVKGTYFHSSTLTGNCYEPVIALHNSKQSALVAVLASGQCDGKAGALARLALYADLTPVASHSRFYNRKTQP